MPNLTPRPAPRGNSQWGEILQLPNLRSQLDLAGANRASWMAQNGAMTSAQQTAMDQLSAALKAQRDAKMAELIAADAPKGGSGGGGGGGRRRGGGGGGAPPLTTPYVTPDTPWAYSPATAPAPALNMHLDPSTIYGPNELFRNQHALPGQKGYIPPHPKPKPKKPPTYKAVRS